MPVYEMCPPGGPLARTQAFDAQRVTLRDPQRSWSGVREEDGVVVFALPAADVRLADSGACCLLWEPGMHGRREAQGPTESEERLEHCRRALRDGVAEGFVIYAGQARTALELLSLRVVRIGSEYWARWGSVARAELPRELRVPCEACA